MTTPAPQQITELLIDWSNGDPAAFDKLMPLVYGELRQLAARHMRGERTNHTLQVTALVNEAYLRLVDQRRVRWQNRAHFFAISAQLMRRILIDHARRSYRRKRGGAPLQLPLDEALVLSAERSEELIALDEALQKLAIIDQRKSKVVELRYFGGLNIDETAAALGVSPNTVIRDWGMAKAWLRREIDAGG